MPESDYLILGVEMKTRKCFSTVWWQAKPQLWQNVLEPPFLSINSKIKWIVSQQNAMVNHIYTNLPVNTIV